MTDVIITEKAYPKDIDRWVKSGCCKSVRVLTDAITPNVKDSIAIAEAAGYTVTPTA